MVEDEHANAGEPGVDAGDLSDECRGNLSLTSKMMKFSSLVLMLYAGYHGFWALVYFLSEDAPHGWRFITTLAYYIYLPCYAAVGWMFWKYSKAVDELAADGFKAVESAAESQAKTWLTVGLTMAIVFGLSIISTVRDLM